VVGYCQGMNLLAAALLLVMEEDDAFWCLVTIVERLLPANYYTSNLLVSQADQRCAPVCVCLCVKTARATSACV
jgi:hypothetical protein